MKIISVIQISEIPIAFYNPAIATDVFHDEVSGMRECLLDNSLTKELAVN